MEQTLETTRQLAEAPAAGCIPTVTEARHALQQIDMKKAQLAPFRTMITNYEKLVRVRRVGGRDARRLMDRDGRGELAIAAG